MLPELYLNSVANTSDPTVVTKLMNEKLESLEKAVILLHNPTGGWVGVWWGGAVAGLARALLEVRRAGGQDPFAWSLGVHQVRPWAG